MPNYIRQAFLYHAKCRGSSFLRESGTIRIGYHLSSDAAAFLNFGCLPLNGRTQAEVVQNRGSQVCRYPSNTPNSVVYMRDDGFHLLSKVRPAQPTLHPRKIQL